MFSGGLSPVGVYTLGIKFSYLLFMNGWKGIQYLTKCTIACDNLYIIHQDSCTKICPHISVARPDHNSAQKSEVGTTSAQIPTL